jgi:putative ABC transport system permease protein
MLRSYFLTAIRNLSKNKLNASINIIGLAVAFTCSILLFLMAHYEFSFDRFQVKADRLFQVYNLAHEEKGDEKSDPMSYPVAPVFKAEVPGIVRATATLSAGQDISYKGKEVVQRITVVDSDFFRMFSFPVVSGNAVRKGEPARQDDQAQDRRRMERLGGLGGLAGPAYQFHDTI